MNASLENRSLQTYEAARRACVVETHSIAGDRAAPRIDARLLGLSLDYSAGGICLKIPAPSTGSVAPASTVSSADLSSLEEGYWAGVDHVPGYGLTHTRAYDEGVRQIRANSRRLIDLDLGPEE